MQINFENQMKPKYDTLAVKKEGVDEAVVGMRFLLHFIESAGIAIDENREQP